MDLIQKLQQLVSQLPDDVVSGMPGDVKKMIVVKFWGESPEVKLSPKVEKLIKVVSSLSDEEKKEFVVNCPLSHNEPM